LTGGQLVGDSGQQSGRGDGGSACKRKKRIQLI
jgi:hypothetical protein